MKISQDSKKTACFKPLSATFFIFLVLTLSQIMLVSAVMEWDNVKSYDEHTKTVTIENALSLGDTIAEIKLLTPQNNFVMRGKDRLVAEFYVDNKENYDNVFNEMEFYNIKNSMSEFDREFTYKYEVVTGTKEVPVYEKQCNEVQNKNGTYYESCERVQTGTTTKQIKEWVTINEKSLPKGVYKLGLFTDVRAGEHIEFIPQWYGKRLTEFAEWTEGLNDHLVSYWSFDTRTTEIPELTLGFHNISVVGSVINTTSAILGNSSTYSGNDEDKIGYENADLSPTNNLTICGWITGSESGSKEVLVARSSAVNDDAYLIRKDTDNTVQFYLGSLSAASSTTTITDDAWYFVCGMYNNTAVSVWINGIQEAQAVVSGNLDYQATTQPTTFGYTERIGNPTLYLDGTLDEFGFWNRSLTSSEITQLYNGGSGITYTDDFTEKNPPNVTINTPLNTSYTGTSIHFNVTALDDTGMNDCEYSLTGGVTNYSMDNSTYIDNWIATNNSMTQTSHLVNFYCWDINNNYNNTESIEFTINLSSVVTILSPTNYTNTTDTGLDVNYTYTQTPNNCWWSEDRSVTNNSITCGENITSETWSEGGNTIFVYVNDSGIVDEDNVFFTLDTTSPTINIAYPTGNVLDGAVENNSKIIYLNFTATDTTLESCWYYNNSANVSITCGQNATFTLPYGTYTHYVYANDSTGNIGSASITVNYDYSLKKNSLTYNSSVLENTIQTFISNVTLNNTRFPVATATLNYNGTNYTSSSTTSGDDIIFSRSLTIPKTDVANNKSFQWFYTLTGTSTSNSNSGSYNQFVNRTNASFAGSPYPAFINFTVYDEETHSKINATFGATIDYGITSLIRTISYEDEDEDTDSFAFGFDPLSQKFLIGGTIEFTATGYVTKTYTIPSQYITNNVTNVSLYLLNSTDSTSFIVYVRDNTYSLVEGAVVHIQRYYPGTNSWNTTEVLTTNYEGKSIGHFVTEDVNYRFRVYVDDTLELSTGSTKIFCEESPCTVTLTLGAEDTTFPEFVNVTDLEYSLVYSDTTETFTYTYNDEETSAEGGRLIVVLANFGNATETTVCDTSSAAVSSVLTCDVSSYGNGTFYAFAYNERTEATTLLDTLIISKAREIIDNLGLDGLIWTVFLIMGIVMIGLSKPAIAIVFTVAAVIIVSILGLASIPAVSIAAIIIMGVVLIWGMRN